MRFRTLLKTGLPLLLIGLAASCSYTYLMDHNFRQSYRNYNSAAHADSSKTAYLKLHLKNGDVVFLYSWQSDSLSVRGEGKRYDFNRRIIAEGLQTVPVDSVVITETNKAIEPRDNKAISTLTVMTVLDLIVSAVCLSNPKACFGSCPTFYTDERYAGVLQYSDAEGFSSAIAPCFEYADIDALNKTVKGGERFPLVMKNEALETHAVNSVRLLAVPARPGERVFAGRDDNFYSCSAIYPLSRASAGPENCLAPLLRPDGHERYSVTDSSRLDAREYIRLEFEAPRGNGYGLVLSFRQTLVTTFLLYSGLSYMGDEYSDVMARLETDGDIREKALAPFEKVGGVEAEAWDPRKKEWVACGMLYETGPIARNTQIIPLPRNISGGKVLMRLRLAKGNWRIDYAALAAISGKVRPVELQPSELQKDGTIDREGLDALRRDDRSYVCSLPKDNYRMVFDIPEGENYELFLRSQGYYIEWIRENWLRHKDHERLEKMLLSDEQVWSELAREFKMSEETMEGAFWSTRIIQ